jgi:hypothetical protein
MLAPIVQQEKPMDATKAHVVKGLWAAREEVMAIKSTEMTHAVLSERLGKHNNTLYQANRVGGVFSNTYGHALQGFENAPPEVIGELRAKVVGFLDESIKAIDSTQIVESILETLIKKIADQKLAALLLEFNSIKDIAPNSAADIFRTIVMLVIQERAKQKAPTSTLATRVDLQLDPMISEALRTNLFDSGEAKFLKLFQPSGKAIFDNVVHKAGANAMVDKAYLNSIVEPLSKLLATIAQ